MPKARFNAKIIDLHPKELSLIIALRGRFRFGEVIIIMRDGVPQRLKKVELFDDLSTT